MNAADRINYLNIGLMIVAAIAAFVLPFEVFLFSYAVLGPLHYLTEISWLHEKRYFTKHRFDYVLLSLVALAIFILAFGTEWLFRNLPALFPGFASLEAVKGSSSGWITGLAFISFASALAMTTLKRSLYRLFAFVFILITAQFIKDSQSALIVFAVFLPTLVHVFLFTGAFVLYGALKTRSRSGILSFVVFLLCPALIWLLNDYGLGRPIGEYVQQSYRMFETLNQKTIDLLHLGSSQHQADIYYSSYGVLVMRVIAYAYTYHYLNWFSKTNVIRWHEISRRRIAAIALLWLAAVGTYAYNYRTGIIALYCLSLLHVFLEFPLNHVTFLGIGREVVRWRRGRTTIAPATAVATAGGGAAPLLSKES